MNVIDKKITFGLIVASRGFFNARLATDARVQILATLDRLGYGYVIPPAEATPNGVIETMSDARICASIFQEYRQDIDGIVVILPNFGDELGVIQTLKYADLGVPVLVQACDDEMDKLDVKNRRDAFCGKLSVCNNLYQYSIPFTDTSRHTCKIDSPLFSQDLDFFARICRVVRGLKNARIGAIGTRPAAFQTVRYSEKLLQDSGITVIPVDLSEIFARAAKIETQAKEVKDRLKMITEYGSIPDYIEEANVIKQAKLSLAIDEWMAENECHASAVQCWTSMQENYGCAACLSMSMMSERLKPSACEVDVAGAVSMYTLMLASGNSPGFLDWNNNFGDNPDMCINTHCSNFPRSFVSEDIEISNLDVLGESLGQASCFGAVKGKVRAGPMTYFRISTDDTEGVIKAYLGEGEFTAEKSDIDGGSAVCRIDNLQHLLKFMCKNGFEHHVAMVRDHVADVVEEAVSNYLNWGLYYHNRY